MKRLVIFAVLAFSTPAIASDPACKAEALSDARKLLLFYSENDSRVEIDKLVKSLPPASNPANSRQKFLVNEVYGYIYKGTYRMRLIYYKAPGSACTLMGEEILEIASL